jgi:hypothetical protein
VGSAHPTTGCQNMALNKFQIPTHLNLPQPIEQELLCLWNKAYGELYEEDWIDSKINITEGELDTDICKILAFYGDASDENSFRRFVYINWALCLSVKRKIICSLSGASEYESVLKDLELWSENNSYSLSDAFNKYTINMYDGPGEVMEAISVYENMLKIPAHQNIVEIVFDSIDGCLQGAAICHGTIDKRAIFNWLIIDVFPNAYFHKLPNYIYTGSFDIDNWEYFERVKPII